MPIAHRFAIQVAPSSVGFSGPKEQLTLMTVIVMTVLMITLRSLCGVKQLQASLQANAPTSTVPSAVKVGMMV